MKAAPLALPDVLLIEPKVYGDSRGLFFESHNVRTFSAAAGHEVQFVQDNHSISKRGVVRGLHYQLPPAPQGKLVRAVVGEIFDVAVDIRRSSSSYGQWVGEILSAENRRQLWIPEGFAHGFMALSDGAEVLYKATDFYHRAAESSIRWDDPDLAIAWPEGLTPILSEKDAAAPAFAEAVTFD
jgi:dTDP-4-dehydrorhamnose 3,5-epimerase